MLGISSHQIKSKGHSLLPEQIFKENVPFASFVSGPLSHPEQTWGADSEGQIAGGLFPFTEAALVSACPRCYSCCCFVA